MHSANIGPKGNAMGIKNSVEYLYLVLMLQWEKSAPPDRHKGFLACLWRAIDGADNILGRVIAKARFWERCAGLSLNERQIKLINRLLDEFEGKLTSSKWAAIAKCSPDSALRDINDLIERGVLKKAAAGGRSTSYELVV